MPDIKFENHIDDDGRLTCSCILKTDREEVTLRLTLEELEKVLRDIEPRIEQAKKLQKAAGPPKPRPQKPGSAIGRAN